MAYLLKCIYNTLNPYRYLPRPVQSLYSLHFWAYSVFAMLFFGLLLALSYFSMDISSALFFKLVALLPWPNRQHSCPQTVGLAHWLPCNFCGNDLFDMNFHQNWPSTSRVEGNGKYDEIVWPKRRVAAPLAAIDFAFALEALYAFLLYPISLSPLN